MNGLTAFIDGSQIYGSDKKTSIKLRDEKVDVKGFVKERLLILRHSKQKKIKWAFQLRIRDFPIQITHSRRQGWGKEIFHRLSISAIWSDELHRRHSQKTQPLSVSKTSHDLFITWILWSQVFVWSVFLFHQERESSKTLSMSFPNTRATGHFISWTINITAFDSA